MTIQWNLPINPITGEYFVPPCPAASNSFAFSGTAPMPIFMPNMSMPQLAAPKMPVFTYIEPKSNNSWRNIKTDKFELTNDFGKNITNIASSYLGYKESDGSYLKFTNGRHEKWCADFVSYCARKAGKSGFNFSSVEGIRQWGIQNNKYKKTPKVGDAIILKNNYSHTGIVKSISGNQVTVIAGNTSNKVKVVTYSLNDPRISGYVSIA